MNHHRFCTTMITIIMTSLFMSTFAAGETSWPRKIVKGDYTIIIYQPQIESLTNVNMESRAAVSVSGGDYESPVFGAMWFDSQISTDRDERIVYLEDVKVTAAKFPDIEDQHVAALSNLLETEIPKWELELSLDQLLADLEMKETALGLSENLNNAPPEIIFKTFPSVLILIDGDPDYKNIEGTSYERVVNTPFFVVRDPKKKDYYIRGGDYWYESDDLFGEWEHTEKVPGKLKQIAKEAIGEVEEAGEDAETSVPGIILRTAPAELLQSDGEPDFAPIEGTSVLYMTNTADDILMDIDSQNYYILISGRWYRSRSLNNGPWDFVEPDKVPVTFNEIPADSDMGTVRSSIAGTQEAREAVLENQIPQTAEVDRQEAKLEITYDGRPQFESIKGTNMKYAVNTDKSVLLIENRYYCCDDAIWFESASATGPWIVSVAVPDQVQEIPPESPVYNVKYVYIYDYTPSTVFVGYTPGYVNSYVYGGCVYYGTGYYYRPWYGAYYYPRPVTYGYNVHWNPYTGWGFSFGVSYGWMTFGWGSSYYGWWGPAGYRHGYHYGYHHGYSHGYRAGYYAGQRASQPRPVPYGSREQTASNNLYRNRSQGVKRTGDTRYDPRTGNQVTPSDRSARPSTQPANRDNNMYTDRNGNVYQRDGNDWKKMDNSSTGQPSTRPSQPSTERPSTRPSQPSTGQPSTRPSQPSTGQPSTRPSSPSRQPDQNYSRPGSTPNTNNLNSEYNSRNRGNERSQQYNQNRQNYQYRSPAGTPSQRSAPSARPGNTQSRPGSSRSAAPARRR